MKFLQGGNPFARTNLRHEPSLGIGARERWLARARIGSFRLYAQSFAITVGDSVIVNVLDSVMSRERIFVMQSTPLR